MKKETPQSKISKVLEHLKSGKPIHNIAAVQLYKYYRLASGIKVLRDRGYIIKTELISQGCSRYAVYTMGF